MPDREAQQDAIIERIRHRESIDARDRLTPRMEAEQILIALDRLDDAPAPPVPEGEGVDPALREALIEAGKPKPHTGPLPGGLLPSCNCERKHR